MNRTFLDAMRSEMAKIAESGGHWRKLDPSQKGHDQNDNEILGKTWVSTGMKPGIKPFKHQESFIEQASSVPEGQGLIAAHGTGTGKCVRGDTLVLTDRGLLRMDEMVQGLPEEPETLVPRPGFKVCTVDGEEVVWKEVRSFYRQRLPEEEPTLVVSTRGGELRPTLSHHLPAVRMGEVVWLPARELTGEDFLAVPRRVPGPPSMTAVPDELVELLAWQIAEGHERPDSNALSISQKDEGVLRDLQTKYASLCQTSGHVRQHEGRVSCLHIQSAEYRGMLEDLGYRWGNLSANKVIPGFLFSLPDAQVRLFLSSFFDAEGHAGKRGVEVSSASFRLLRGIQYLLARFGVRAALSEREAHATNSRSPTTRTYYRLHILGDDARAFHEYVGFSTPRKAQALADLCSRRRNPNTGIPVGDLLQELHARGVTARSLGLGTRQGKCGTLDAPAVSVAIQGLRYLATPEARAHYEGQVNALGGMAQGWAKRTLDAITESSTFLLECANRMERLLKGGFSFERVTRVGVGETGGYVYDLEVEEDVWGNKNYLAGPVLLVHNTLAGIMQFEKRMGEGKSQRALVVTPAGLRDNFANKGIRKFTNSKAAVVRRPDEPVPDDVSYIVVSYSAFRNNPVGFVQNYGVDTIIADEFQRASNPDSKTNQAFWEVRNKVGPLYGLTASITQNDPSEVVPLLQLARGDRAPYESKAEFTKRHVKKVPTKVRGIFGGTTYKKVIQRDQELRRRIGPNIHYVEDLDATEKPPSFVTRVPVEMSKPQVDLYHMSLKGVDPNVVRAIREGRDVKDRDKMGVFERLMRARQVSNSLHTVTGMTPEQAAQETPKIKRILDDTSQHLKETPDGKVIIYTNLVHGGADVLAAGLREAGIPFGLFIGQGRLNVTAETRQQDVDDYIAGKKRVLLITGAGAEGLSLGNTTMVALADGHYNPERIAQAQARGIRAGGQAHRPMEQRRVDVRQYVSALPKTFWQKITFQPATRSVDQYVYLTAERKAAANKELRAALMARTQHEDRRRESPWYRIVNRRAP